MGSSGKVRLHSLSALQEEFTLMCSNGLSCGYLEEIGLCNQIRQILYLDLALQNTYHTMSVHGTRNIWNILNLR